MQAIAALVFNFAETRSGDNVREFLGQDGEHPWNGKLVTDGFSGYKATFERGVTEVGCAANARRKFHELWANTRGPRIAHQGAAKDLAALSQRIGVISEIRKT